MECVRLDLSDLDLGERTLLVRNGKGRKDRFVPLAGRAHAALEAYCVRLGRCWPNAGTTGRSSWPAVGGGWGPCPCASS